MQASFYIRPDSIVVTFENLGPPTSPSTLQMELFVSGALFPPGSMRTTWLQVQYESSFVPQNQKLS